MTNRICEGKSPNSPHKPASIAESSNTLMRPILPRRHRIRLDPLNSFGLLNNESSERICVPFDKALDRIVRGKEQISLIMH